MEDVVDQFDAQGRIERWYAHHITRCMWAMDCLSYGEQCRMTEHFIAPTDQQPADSSAAEVESEPTTDDLDKTVVEYVVNDSAVKAFDRARAHLRREMNFYIEKLRLFQQMRRMTTNK